MRNYVDIANKTIKKPNGNTVFVGDLDLNGIIREIIKADKYAPSSTVEFSKAFQGLPIQKVAEHLFYFVKNNIKYKEDKIGIQDIKQPSVLWHDKIGDCKSFSLFIRSVLTNLKIRSFLRFASYDLDKKIGHVYVVIQHKGIEIPLDATYKELGDEKPNTFQKDIMPKVYHINSTSSRKLGELDLGDLDTLTDEKLDLYLMRQRVEIAKKITEKVRGVGTSLNDGRDAQIKTINKTLEILNSNLSPEEKAHKIDYQAVSGSSVNGFSKFLNNVKNKLKSGVKTLSNVATSPLRLVAKGILQVTLPRASYFFLYLFIPSNKLSNLNEGGRRKRNKALKIKKIIVSKLKMKESHFMALVKNGIMKTRGKTPEAILRQSGLAGVGSVNAIPPEAIQAVVQLITTIISKIGGKEKVSSDDVPNTEEDFINNSIPMHNNTPYYEDPETGLNTDNGGRNKGFC